MELLFEGFLDNLAARVPEHAFLVESIRAAFEATSLDQIDQNGLVSIIRKDITKIKDAVTSIWEKTAPELKIYPEYLNARQSLYAFKSTVLNQIDTTLNLLRNDSVSTTSKLHYIKAFEVFFKDCMASVMGDLDTDNKVGISTDVLNFAISHPETGLLSMQKDYEKLITDIDALTKRNKSDLKDSKKRAAEQATAEVPVDDEVGDEVGDETGTGSVSEADDASNAPSLMETIRAYEPETAQVFDDACRIIDNSIGGAVFMVPTDERDSYGGFIETVINRVREATGVTLNNDKRFIFERINQTPSKFGDIYRFMTSDDNVADAAFISKNLQPIVDIITRVGKEEFGNEYIIHSFVNKKVTLGATRTLSNGVDQNTIQYTQLAKEVYAKEHNTAQIKQDSGLTELRDGQVETQINAIAKKVADYANASTPDDLVANCTPNKLVSVIGMPGYSGLVTLIANILAPYIVNHARSVYSERSGIKHDDDFEWSQPATTEGGSEDGSEDADNFGW